MKCLFLLLLFLTGCAKFHDQVVVVVPKDFTGIVTLRIVQDTLHDGPPRRILHYYRPGYLDTVYGHVWVSPTVAINDGSNLKFIKSFNFFRPDLDKIESLPKGIFYCTKGSFDGVFKESFRNPRPGDQHTSILVVDTLVNYKLRIRQLDSTRKQIIQDKYGYVYY